MTLRKLRLPLLALAGALCVAAASASEVTEKSTQTHPLAAGGSVALSNMNGDVDIVAWDRDEVQIVAEKFARDEERLARISIDVDARPDRITIKTKYPQSERSWFVGKANRNPGGVRYTLRVPARLAHLKVDVMNSAVTVEGVRGDVKIATMNGRIEATGLAGDAELDSMNGRIFASFVTVRHGQQIKLDTMNGSCTVEVPRDAGAAVRASTMNGRVRAELPITVERSSRRSLRGTLGDGGARITLESMNGSLTLRARS